MDEDRILSLLRQEPMTAKEIRRWFRTMAWPWTMSTDAALLQLRMQGAVVVGAGMKYRLPNQKERMT